MEPRVSAPADVVVGEFVELQVDTDQGTESFRTDVRDLHGEWIVLSLPPRSRLAGADGREVRVVKKTERGMLVVEAVVVSRSAILDDRLTLRRGGDWQRLQRRSNVRLPIEVVADEAKLLDVNPPEPVGVTILNVSASGCLLLCSRPIGKLTRLGVRFGLPGLPPPVEAVVEVVRLEPSEQTAKQPGHRAGCRFVEIRTGDQDRIVRFIFREQARLRRERWL